MKHIALVSTILFALALCAFAQDVTNQPNVTLVTAEPVAVRAGSSAPATLLFRVNSGFHVNSNTPNSELLIPTTLKLSPPTEVMISNLKYPTGEQLTFPFSPDEKLSVYSGDFKVTAMVRPTKTVSAGTYRVHGELKYQACNNRQCFPPKTVPVAFDVKVEKAKSTTARRNPGQSPNIHR